MPLLAKIILLLISAVMLLSVDVVVCCDLRTKVNDSFTTSMLYGPMMMLCLSRFADIC